MEIKTAYAKIIGSQITDKDLQRLLAIQSVLGIKNNDAIWAILLALEGYLKLYKKIPAEIKAVTEQNVEAVKEQADCKMKEAAATIVTSLEKEIQKEISKIIGQTKTNLPQLITASLVTSLVFLGGVFVGSTVWTRVQTSELGIDDLLKPIALLAVFGNITIGMIYIGAFAPAMEKRILFFLIAAILICLTILIIY